MYTGFSRLLCAQLQRVFLFGMGSWPSAKGNALGRIGLLPFPEGKPEGVIPGSRIIGTRGTNAVALLDTYRVSNAMNCAAQSQRNMLNPHGIGRKLPPVTES